MKLLLIALMFALNSYASEQNFIIEGYKQVPGMEFQLELVPKKPIDNHRVLLDCQSFINGLHYENLNEDQWKDIWFLMMDGYDCEKAYGFSRELIDKCNPFCVRVNVDNKDINFFSNPEDCQENL